MRGGFRPRTRCRRRSRSASAADGHAHRRDRGLPASTVALRRRSCREAVLRGARPMKPPRSAPDEVAAGTGLHDRHARIGLRVARPIEGVPLVLVERVLLLGSVHRDEQHALVVEFGQPRNFSLGVRRQGSALRPAPGRSSAGESHPASPSRFFLAAELIAPL